MRKLPDSREAAVIEGWNLNDFVGIVMYEFTAN